MRFRLPFPGASLVALAFVLLIFLVRGGWASGWFNSFLLIVGWIGILLFFALLPFDFRFLKRPLGLAGEYWNRLSSWFGKHRRLLLSWEAILALLIVLPSALTFGKMVHTMSEVSLRVDEIGSVRAYTSRSPFEAASKYRLAKNHIFFSVVNSVTPASNSLNPLRARFWSFVAISAALLLMLWYLWRNGSPLAGALAFALPATNIEFLSKALQARGFGFLTLAGAIAIIAFHAYLKDGSKKALWILVIAVVLGVWTIPFFLLFGASLLLILYGLRRSQETLSAGIVAALAIFVLYLPVLGGLWAVTAGYSEEYEGFFTSFPALIGSLHYAFPFSFFALSPLNLFMVAGATLLVALLTLDEDFATRASLLATGALIVAFCAFCLAMQSPPARVMSSLAMPVALLFGFSVMAVLRWRAIRPIRPFLAAVFAFPTITYAWEANERFAYEADQRWEELATEIRNRHPEGAVVYVPQYRNMVHAYLRSGYKVKERLPSQKEVGQAETVIVDPAHNGSHQPLKPGELYPEQAFESVRFPVRGGIEQVLYFSSSDEAQEKSP